jgi:branched-chain amino acid transport system ATP-binding protein
MSNDLIVSGVEVVYQRAIVALHEVSFRVNQGQIVALIGSNGAGKTTSLRACSGFIGLDNARVTKGSIVFKGQSLIGLRPPEVARRGIVVVPERDKVFPNLTVAENLAVVLCREPDRRKRLNALVYDSFPRLAELRDKEAGLLSGGERQMLAIGAAILCAPELLMIDELSMGLAPVIIEDLIRRLLEVRRELGITLLLVEQSAAAVLSFADYAFVLENGRVAMHGEAARLRDDDDVRKLYLGLSDSGRVNYRDARRLRLESAGRD